MSTATLGKIALGLTFPVVGVVYFYQRSIAKKFSEQPYYKEAMELVKGYKPITEKLGEPIYANRLDLSDPFNYHDGKTARAKIPLKGSRSTADVLVYATKNDAEFWNLDYMEVQYPNTRKYKFYDSSLVNKSIEAQQNKD